MLNERATLPHIHCTGLVVSGANDRLTMADASHMIELRKLGIKRISRQTVPDPSV